MIETPISTARLCMIGNSHLACLKLAGDEDKALLPAHSIEYFAGSANSMESLRLSDEYFLSTDDVRLRQQMSSVSLGKEHVDIRDYDAFVIVGLGYEYRDFFRLFRNHCLTSDGKWQAGRQPVSDAYVTEVITTLYQARPGNRIARQIRLLTGKPVVFVPAPYPVESVLALRPNRAYGALRGTGYFAELAALYARCAAEAARTIDAGLAPQTAETQDPVGFTAARFNHRPVGLMPVSRTSAESWHAEKTRYDAWHMNVDFGRARLNDIAAAFTAGVPA